MMRRSSDSAAEIKKIIKYVKIGLNPSLISYIITYLYCLYGHMHNFKEYLIQKLITYIFYSTYCEIWSIIL